MTPRVSDQVAAVASSMTERLPALEADLVERLLDEIPELRGDEAVKELLAASARANIAMSLDVLAHGIDVTKVAAPPAAAEYARRLAQRGVPVEALLRAYRVGHGNFLGWWLRELEDREAERSEVVGVMSVVVDVGWRYIDRISEQLIAVYFGERERWLQSASAARGARVRSLLSDEPPDVNAAEAALGYRLRRWHVGVVAWIEPTQAVGDGLVLLDRVAAALARGSLETPLVVMSDEASLWAWVPVRPSERLVQDELGQSLSEPVDSVRVALGDPAEGLEGFRLTHHQALLARTVAEAAGADAGSVTAYADSSLIAFLVSDLGMTRVWVRHVLGPLATDDEPTARLRETVQVFLETKGSYTETAARLHLHKNTVHYRIRKAEELRGRPLDDDRIGVEVALMAYQRLGPIVLEAGRGDPGRRHS